MARKVQHVTITAEGRDKGKVFQLTEMAAIPADKWATKLLFLMRKYESTIPPDAEEQAMVGLAEVQLPTMAELIAFKLAMQDDSVSEWWDCVRYVHDPKHPPQAIMQGDACQIEDTTTITRLAIAVKNLHTDFFSAEKASTSA